MQLIKLPPFENYMYKLTQAVGALKIMAASRYYHKGVFDLSEEAVVQEVVEKGLVVGSKYVPLKLLEELGTWVVPNLGGPNWGLIHFLQDLSRVLSQFLPSHWGARTPHSVFLQPSNYPVGDRGRGKGDLHSSLPGVPQLHPLHDGGSEVLPMPGTLSVSHRGVPQATTKERGITTYVTSALTSIPFASSGVPIPQPPVESQSGGMQAREGEVAPGETGSTSAVSQRHPVGWSPCSTQACIWRSFLPLR